MLTVESRNRDFPTLQNRVYLNSAAEGIPPLTVRDAAIAYVNDKMMGMESRPAHEERLAALRRLTGEMYGLSADEIAVCSCSSEAFDLAAQALRLNSGDEVVISDLDYPSGSTPWLHPNSPATVKIWRSHAGVLRIEDLAPLLGSKTRLVSLCLVSYLNGFKLAVPEVVECVRKYSSSLIALDVTQALGRVPLVLEGVDLIISSTHKWTLGSHGGCLVGVPKHRAEEWTVPVGGWRNLERAFESDRFERPPSNQPGAASFMVGMPSFGAIYAVYAGLSYVHDVGIEAIARAADSLVWECLNGLARLPIELITANQPENLAGIVAFRHPNGDFIQKKLLERNIHVLYHSGRLRVAIHGYNTPEDVETLLRALREIL